MVSEIHGLRAASPSASIERHVVQSVPLALEGDLQGAEYLNIAAADTAMERPSRDLMVEVVHGVYVDNGATGTDTLRSINKAHRLLGYTPDST
jgi:hypothetical protein